VFPLSRIHFSKFAAMGSLVVLSTLGSPARSVLTSPFSRQLAVSAS
jgi:hypothetical protein